MPGAVGIVLAAGAGRRYGGPKALVRADDGVAWVERSCAVLRAGGCTAVIVALGARADDAAPLVPGWARTVVVPDWEQGVSASLRAGLEAAAGTTAWAAVITLVDLPGLRPEAVRRLLRSDDGAGDAAEPDALRRAVYDSRPGHPVVIGRSHWDAVGRVAAGDHGAAPYLRSHGAVVVDCTDLGGGADVDRPGDA